MIGNRLGPALLALLLFAPLSANALGVASLSAFSSGGDASNLNFGDVLTLEVVIENAAYQDVSGLSLQIGGYDVGVQGNSDDNNLIFLNGQVAAEAFSTTNLAPGVSVGGLPNVRTEAVELGTPFPFEETLRVSLFEGAALTPSNGFGSLDIGVDGVEIFNGDVHFRVQFRAKGGLVPTVVDLSIGGLEEFGGGAVGPDGSLLPFTNATFSTTVIPEPGTALLMGLGLAGLAANRRR